MHWLLFAHLLEKIGLLFTPTSVTLMVLAMVGVGLWVSSMTCVTRRVNVRLG